MLNDALRESGMEVIHTGVDDSPGHVLGLQIVDVDTLDLSKFALDRFRLHSFPDGVTVLGVEPAPFWGMEGHRLMAERLCSLLREQGRLVHPRMVQTWGWGKSSRSPEPLNIYLGYGPRPSNRFDPPMGSDFI